MNSACPMRCVALAAGLAALAAPARLAAQYPTAPPSPTPLRPVRFPAFVEGRLASGLDLLLVEHHEQPVVTLSLSVPAGAFYEPAAQAGLADLMAEVLTKGTAHRTAEQIAEEIEGAGGSISASAGDDFLTITVTALASSLPQALDVLADVVINATFPAEEVELARTRALSALQVSLSRPDVLAARQFEREVYGEHPYGRQDTPASLRSITREDVVRLFQERVRPQGALLVIAGDVSPARARRLAAQVLADWRGSPAAAPAAPAVPARTATEIVLVHRPGAVQSNIVAGFPFITPRDPALYPLTLMNRILGGGADSRLFLILREQRGWTYGAYSSFSRPRHTGAFRAGAEVRTEVTDSALTELLRQLERMRTEVPADSEIRAAKNYLVGRFPLTIETPEQIAGALANARLLGLPRDYVQRYRERLSAVTPAQLAAAARRHLATDRMAIVVVGDAPRILPGLRGIAPIRIVDTEGRPLTVEDLAPRAGPLAVREGAIREGTWRYRILFQGNPFGEETRTIARAREDGRAIWRLVGSTRLGPVLRQDDTIAVDSASLAPISVRQVGAVGGQATHVRLDYAEGRVRGSSRTPRGPGQTRELTIDTTVAEGVLDDNTLPLALTALPYQAGARWNLAAFSGGEGAVLSYSVSVEGEQDVTVPAGTFPAWRIAVTGGQVPATMYIAREQPVIVKIELSGAPLVFELTGSN